MTSRDRTARPTRRRSSSRGAVVLLAATVLLAAACAAAPGPPTTQVPPPGPDDVPVRSAVVGGSWAEIEQFPWMTGILARNISDPYLAQFCGGARVSQTKVLTAAHCVVDDGQVAPAAVLDVYYGSTQLTAGLGTRAAVTGVAVHPSYTQTFAGNDLAVLTVDAPTDAAPTIEVITPEAGNTTFPGRRAQVAGWGCSSLEPAIYGDCVAAPLSLRMADLTVRSTSYCGAAVPGFAAATMLCAGTVSNLGTAADACYGDSGGPLSVAGSRGPLLAGLVSFGPGCGAAPTAYTRLAIHRSWLRANGVPMRDAPFTTAPLTPQVSGSYQPLVGDFDGDGRADVYWYVPGRATDWLWRGSPAGPVPGPATRQVNGTYAPVVGDLDADGDDDILWYAPGPGPETLWRGSPSGSFSSEAGRPVNGTYVPLVGDFDATHGDDVYWYGVGTSPDALWLSTPSDPTSFSSVTARPVNGVYSPAVGDLDGDGGDDIYWYAPGPGDDHLWRNSPTGPAPGPSVLQLNGTYQLLSGDFDGDGRDDLFGYGAGTAVDLVWRGSAGGLDRQTDVMVNGVYRPAAGDLDGDGRDDVLWHGPGSTGDSWFAGVNVP